LGRERGPSAEAPQKQAPFTEKEWVDGCSVSHKFAQLQEFDRQQFQQQQKHQQEQQLSHTASAAGADYLIT
jgi:hypothetical protein